MDGALVGPSEQGPMWQLFIGRPVKGADHCNGLKYGLVNAVEKCHSGKNTFKVPLGSVAPLTPLHGKYYISVNFMNF